MKLKSLVALPLSLALCASLAAQERAAVKQLAGPIDEIRSGVMAPVADVDNAVHSKSAMIPVELVQTLDGTWRWDGSVAIDGDQIQMVLFSGEESWNLEVGPNPTKRLAAHQVADVIDRDALAMGSDRWEGDYYAFNDVQPGEWSVAITADAPAVTRGFLLSSSESEWRLVSYRAAGSSLLGDEISFVGFGGEQTAFGGPSVKVQGQMISEGFLRVTAPDGTEFVRMMSDAGDGSFIGSFFGEQAGDYVVQMHAYGTTPDGAPFVRTAQHLVPVIAPQIDFARDVASARAVSDDRVRISVPVAVGADSPEMYRVFAEVWGPNAAGDMIASNWIGGMVYVENDALNLGLDTRWLALAGVRGEFELRNVRVEDPDTFIPVLELDRMDVELRDGGLTGARVMPPKAIDEAMLMGPRPTKIQNSIVAAKAGTKMLVHGYCSGDAWGPVQGSFSPRHKFTDFNKNRSHNAFAQEIINQGSGYSSYGIIAHSQGGAAATHLYTYYWSGLDYVTNGSRLIQSVGTPYGGTSLAGNAAVLGQIFGAGCGSNYDLTYNGASAWQGGIPSWARGAVNYYTTAFKDNWWSYDYCHLVTDLLLNDPDDGTTEKSRGQFSGAVNRGHKSGWCHTTGMAEPPQVQDGGRNSTMNSNGAY